jgi:ribosome-associated protein
LRHEPLHAEIAKLTTSALTSRGLLAADGAPRALSADSLSLTEKLVASLDEAKAEDVATIDLRDKTSLADVMIIATGRSSVHVGAIADRVLKACKAAGISARIEGLPQCDWVLVDAGDAIIHIFRPEVRQFYNLEKMWGGDRPREMRLV